MDIRAVEGFSKYITPLHDYAYDAIYNHNFADRNNWHHYVGYDMVLLIDSLEHLDKQTGLDLLDHLKLNNKHIIVSVPWGDDYLEQGAVNGNEFERHRGEWSPSDLIRLGGVELYRGICVVSRFSFFNPNRPQQPPK